MLTSLALILAGGLIAGLLFQKLKLPGLIGMILVGIILSPHAANLLDNSILNIAGDLRQIALVIILTRAGLTLNVKDLKQVGRPAVLLCFVPACFEIVGILILGPIFFRISFAEAGVLGAVLAAVSPAVIVPRMIRLMEEGYGTKKSIPQMILAGASVDDVFVIVVFTSFLSMVQEKGTSAVSFIQVPIAIALGILLGVVFGGIFVNLFKKIHVRDSAKVILQLSLSFLCIAIQNWLENKVPVSGLIAIMVLGIYINQTYEVLAQRLSIKYNQLWVAAEIILFVLVGATVDLQYVTQSGLKAVFIVILALGFRMVGVLCSLIGTKISRKERVFCMISYTPKATVQAAISGIPLAMGLACGNLVLTIAVIAILITAPFGAICIDRSYKKLLIKN